MDDEYSSITVREAASYDGKASYVASSQPPGQDSTVKLESEVEESLEPETGSDSFEVSQELVSGFKHPMRG